MHHKQEVSKSTNELTENIDEKIIQKKSEINNNPKLNKNNTLNTTYSIFNPNNIDLLPKPNVISNLNQKENNKIYESNNQKNNNINIIQKNDNEKLKQKINNQIIKIKNALNNNFTQKRKIGLKGKENCDYSYLNSLIQCLVNIPDILLYFQKNINYINKPKKYPLTFCFFIFVERLYQNTNNNNFSIYSSGKFIGIIEHCFPLLKVNKNPIDLFHLLIYDIHNELNKAFIKREIKPKVINKTNLSEVIDFEIKKFNHYNKSFISDIFNIFFKKEIKCRTCNKIFYELQHLFSFDLDIINTYKISHKNELNIYDCLNYYINPSEINRICYLCKKASHLLVKKIIFSPPKILTFILSRNNKKEEEEIMKIKFKYDEVIELDIANYINSKLVKIQKQYILISVLAYSFDEKKFVGFCKNLFSNEWICFNDEKINSINYEYIINKSSPYILFYKLVEGKN